MNLPILPTLHTLPILPIFHTLHRYIDTEGCFRPDRLKQIAARSVYIYVYVYYGWLVARLHYRLKPPQSMFQGVQCVQCAYLCV